MNRNPNGTPSGDAVPMSPDAEQAVLGAMLVDHEAFDVAARYLRPSHFHAPKHATIYARILAVRAAGSAVDYLTVSNAIGAAGEAATIGGSAYLAELIARCPVAHHVEHYALTVREAWVRREMIAAAGQIAAAGYDTSADVDGALAYMRRLAESFDDDVALAETGDAMEAHAELGAPRPGGWPTGVDAIDDMLGGYGIMASNITCITAPTGTFKTFLAMHWARAALEAGATVCDFSIEMPRIERLCRFAAVSPFFGAAALRLIGDPERWSDNDRRVWGEIGEYVRSFGGRYRVFEHQRDVEAMNAIVRRVGADVAIIDPYQNLRRPSGCRDRNDADEANSLSLERAAKKSGCAYVVISQMDVTSVREVMGGMRAAGSAMRYAKELGQRAGAELILSWDKQSTSSNLILRIEPRKSRHGRGAHQRTEDEFLFRLDPATGTVRPLVDPSSMVPIGLRPHVVEAAS